MTWFKVAVAARDRAGGVSPKLLYQAIAAGTLRAARIGAGRNLLVSDEAIDEWLHALEQDGPVASIDDPRRRAAG